MNKNLQQISGKKKKICKGIIKKISKLLSTKIIKKCSVDIRMHIDNTQVDTTVRTQLWDIVSGSRSEVSGFINSSRVLAYWARNNPIAPIFAPLPCSCTDVDTQQQITAPSLIHYIQYWRIHSIY